MTRSLVLLLCALAVGCGGNSPTSPTPSSVPSPSPTPTPSPTPPAPTSPPPPATWNGTVTNTVTGAPVAGFSALLNGSRVTISAPGYVTRETRAMATGVDLFPEAGFALAFYRQLVRGAKEGRMEPLWVLSAAPSFYLEVGGDKGLSAEKAARMEAVARRVVPQITGGRFQVSVWQTGPTPRVRQPGWIMIERRDNPDACGSAYVGDSAGQILMSNDDQRCRYEATFAHELGHAFGFWHVDRAGAMMWDSPDKYRLSAPDAPAEIERHHMALAYARPRGNRDIDSDPATAAAAARSLRMVH